MALHLYNTLGRKVEPFEPQTPGEVRMYTCGPTVYDRAHIGNFRAFVWEDLLRRYLRWKGLRVNQVMNLTDVDDRTIGAAVQRGATLSEITEPVIRAFREDWETLGLESVEHQPRATDHVADMIRLVERLEQRGLTYSRGGSIYFAIERFPRYGRLIDLDRNQLRSGGWAEGDEEYDKEDPRDFVLWKGGIRPEEGAVAVWDSPWGRGRPGWHLECSAMAMAYLGETLDIHTGGVDNIFPHHVNEMAQSEAATGKPFARLWLHVAHLLVEGEKMSKSLGNFHTVRSLVAEGIRPSAIRYLLLSGHYRSQLNFTRRGLAMAESAVERLREFRHRLHRIEADGSDGGVAQAARGDGLAFLAGRARASFEAAMDDDLNVSDALASVFGFVREANARLDRNGNRASRSDIDAGLGVMDAFDRVFGVLALREREQGRVSAEFEAWVEERLEAREKARLARDFELADAIRREIEETGVQVKDTPAGVQWSAAIPEPPAGLSKSQRADIDA